MFGTNGVRGPVGETITAQTALRLGRAVGTDSNKVVVGRDTRRTGILLEHGLAAGLLERGVDVIYLGIESSPTLARAVEWTDADVGVMITGSHNPQEENGLKFFTATGRPFDRTEHRSILRRANGQSVPLDRPITPGTENMITTFGDRHVNYLQSQFPHFDLSVVVDLGNGAGRVTADVLSSLGCRVTTIHGQPDGTFPGREIEPTEANCKMLREVVPSIGADIGIAHDADADRLAVVDETGAYVSGDTLLALLCDRAAASGHDLVVPVNASTQVETIANKYGQEVIRTPVGDSFVASALTETETPAFGGESSGTMMWSTEINCSDAHFAACNIVSLVASEGRLSTLTEPFNTHVLKRYKYPTQDAELALDRVRNRIIDTYETIEMIDGIKIWTKNGTGWALIRPSRTEPVVRLTVESKSAAMTQSLSDKFDTVVTESVKGIRSIPS